MLKKLDPTRTASWQRLTEHFNKAKDLHMKDLFAADPGRFEKFSIRFNDIFLDYSKNRITEDTVRLLLGLTEEAGLKDAIDKMFTGDKINETEDRAVLHVALRNRESEPIHVDGRHMMPRRSFPNWPTTNRFDRTIPLRTD